MIEALDITKPTAGLIVARSQPGHVIGTENRLPWRLKTDLKRFKALTTDHVVVMGRKTFQSIGKPLPNRVNIVLSRGNAENIDGVVWASSFDEALRLAEDHSIRLGVAEYFVIGGDQIYRMFQDRGLDARVYLTEVFSGDIKGDAHFEGAFDQLMWHVVEDSGRQETASDEFPFRFVTYERR